MLENYRITSELTRTQNCCLWLAQHVSTGQKVVLKSLLPDALGDSDLSLGERQQRFRRECNIHLYLRHESIVEALAYFEHEGQPYLVTAYKPYPTLKELLQRKVSFSPLEALNIVQQLCQALHYIHDQGIIHRDIHPENIMITEENRICLIDFGCARKVFAPGVTQETLLKGEIQWQGTFYYMSPEQFLGQSELDFRTDIFSVGVILYQLLTRHLPFEGEALSDTMHNLLEQEPHSLVSQNPYVPPALEEVVFQTLRKDPDYRTPTARKLALEIEALLKNADLYYGEARWHLEKNKSRDSAQEYLLQALQQDDQHVPALELLGRLFMLQKNWLQARRCYERLLEQQPRHTEARFHMGQIEMHEGYGSCAVKAFERALESEPTRSDVQWALAEALMKENRYAESLGVLVALMNTDSENSRVFALAGEVYKAQGNSEAALECYEKAYRLHPHQVDVLTELAALQHELGYYTEAALAYQELLKFDNSSQMQHNLANVYYQTGEIGECRLILERLIREHGKVHSPEWEMSYNLLGFVYSRLSQHEDAIDMYKHALICNPEKLENYLFLAAAYREKLQLEDALNTLKYVSERNCGQREAMVYFLIARAYYEQGKEDDTIHALEQCLSCHSTLTSAMQHQASQDLDLLYARQKVRLRKQKQARFRRKESSTVRDYSRETSMSVLSLPATGDEVKRL